MLGGPLLAICHVARAGAAAIAITAFLTASAHAQSLKPDTSRPTKIGVFLNSIFDINPARDSYVADLYVWSLSPSTGPDPLDPVAFPRAKSQTVVEKWSEIHGDTLWSVRRFRCDMTKDWDLGDYPFDLHIVNIVIGPYADAAILPPLEVDAAHSGANANATSKGWRLKGFQVKVQSITYATNFGDPSTEENEPYGWIAASFELDRHGWWIFLKLMTGAYIAFAVAMLACLMKTNHPPIFSGRMGLQIACLFAVIINHRSTNSSVGRDDVFCLPDTLHLIIYALIFAAIFITLRSRLLNERGEEKQAIRWERRMTLVVVAIFAAANLLFIPAAIFTPPHQDDLAHASHIAK
ncbi:MAG: hypothetical protein WAM53_16790 [Terrimicrobiaceae bacterium]